MFAANFAKIDCVVWSTGKIRGAAFHHGQNTGRAHFTGLKVKFESVLNGRGALQIFRTNTIQMLVKINFV